MYEYIYIGLMFVFAIVALLNFSYLAAYETNKQKLRFKRKSKILKALTKDKNEISEIDALFNRYGIAMKGGQYQMVRYITLAMLVAFWLLNALIYKTSSIWGPLAIVFFIASVPKEEFLKIKTPLHHFFNFYSKSYQKKRDIELYNLISQIKNIYITLNGNIGSDYVLREILKFTKYTKNMFIRFVSLWNLNKKEEAVEYFIDATQSDVGRDIAHIFDKLDKLKKDDILEQLSMYQKNVKQNKETLRVKRQETKSTLYYSLSVFLVILILLNMLITLVFSNLLHQFSFLL